jgi:hypothetical protein
MRRLLPTWIMVPDPLSPKSSHWIQDLCSGPVLLPVLCRYKSKAGEDELKNDFGYAGHRRTQSKGCVLASGGESNLSAIRKISPSPVGTFLRFLDLSAASAPAHGMMAQLLFRSGSDRDYVAGTTAFIMRSAPMSSASAMLSRSARA